MYDFVKMLHKRERYYKYFYATTLCLLGSLRFGFSNDVIVVQTKTADISCYDPAIANQYDDFYVEVYFTPIAPSSKTVMVCSYHARLKNKHSVSTDYTGRLEFENTGRLKITYIGLRDEGNYECQWHAFRLNPNSLYNNIIVYVTPRVEVRKVNDPLVADSPIMNAAQCRAINGKPPAQVSWDTDRRMEFNQSVISDTNSELTTVTSTLYVEPTKFYNGLSFKCKIAHPAFKQDNVTVILLNVTYPPDTPIIIVNNDMNHLTCSSQGNPPPELTWQLPEGAPSRTYRGATVALVSPNDPMRANDTYVCTAENGVGEGKSVSITTGTAVTVVQFTEQANVGPIVGGIIGGLLILLIIGVLVYFFVVKKSREKDEGPYQQRSNLINYNTEGYNARPTIQHANDSLNKNRPPSPTGPPPDEKVDHDEDVEDSHTSGSDTDEGQHDIDLEDPSMTMVDPAPHDSAGITSRSSMNFRARRKRPSTSPGSRRSRGENQMQHQGDSPVPAPREPRYDMPPGEHYDDDMQDIAHPEDDVDHYPPYKGDGYPYQQPQYVGYPDQQPPRRTDSLPQYEPKYSQIDHSAYKKGNAPRRPPFEEPVEYAQIRHGYSHVV